MSVCVLGLASGAGVNVLHGGQEHRGRGGHHQSTRRIHYKGQSPLRSGQRFRSGQ